MNPELNLVILFICDALLLIVTLPFLSPVLFPPPSVRLRELLFWDCLAMVNITYDDCKFPDLFVVLFYIDLFLSSRKYYLHRRVGDTNGVSEWGHCMDARWDCARLYHDSRSRVLLLWPS